MPPNSRIAPTMIARSPASATARASSPRASGRIAAAMIGASAESGPSTRMRDGPKSAYARSGTMVAYRPVSGGSPATSA